MNAHRPAPAPNALFEKPSAEDIDRALSVLTEIDGPAPELVAAPVDFSSRVGRPAAAPPAATQAAPPWPTRPARATPPTRSPWCSNRWPTWATRPRGARKRAPLFSGTGEMKTPRGEGGDGPRDPDRRRSALRRGRRRRRDERLGSLGTDEGGRHAARSRRRHGQRRRPAQGPAAQAADPRGGLARGPVARRAAARAAARPARRVGRRGRALLPASFKRRRPRSARAPPTIIIGLFARGRRRRRLRLLYEGRLQAGLRPGRDDEPHARGRARRDGDARGNRAAQRRQRRSRACRRRGQAGSPREGQREGQREGRRRRQGRRRGQDDRRDEGGRRGRDAVVRARAPARAARRGARRSPPEAKPREAKHSEAPRRSGKRRGGGASAEAKAAEAKPVVADVSPGQIGDSRVAHATEAPEERRGPEDLDDARGRRGDPRRRLRRHDALSRAPTSIPACRTRSRSRRPASRITSA